MWRHIADLPIAHTDTRVNGCPADSDVSQMRWIPLEAAEDSTIPKGEWKALEPGGPVKGPTAGIPGGISSIDAVFAERHRGLPLGELLSQIGERICTDA